MFKISTMIFGTPHASKTFLATRERRIFLMAPEVEAVLDAVGSGAEVGEEGRDIQGKLSSLTAKALTEATKVMSNGTLTGAQRKLFFINDQFIAPVFQEARAQIHRDTSILLTDPSIPAEQKAEIKAYFKAQMDTIAKAQNTLLRKVRDAAGKRNATAEGVSTLLSEGFSSFQTNFLGARDAFKAHNTPELIDRNDTIDAVTEGVRSKVSGMFGWMKEKVNIARGLTHTKEMMEAVPGQLKGVVSRVQETAAQVKGALTAKRVVNSIGAATMAVTALAPNVALGGTPAPLGERRAEAPTWHTPPASMRAIIEDGKQKLVIPADLKGPLPVPQAVAVPYNQPNDNKSAFTRDKGAIPALAVPPSMSGGVTEVTGQAPASIKGASLPLATGKVPAPVKAPNIQPVIENTEFQDYTITDKDKSFRSIVEGANPGVKLTSAQFKTAFEQIQTQLNGAELIASNFKGTSIQVPVFAPKKVVAPAENGTSIQTHIIQPGEKFVTMLMNANPGIDEVQARALLPELVKLNPHMASLRALNFVGKEVKLPLVKAEKGNPGAGDVRVTNDGSLPVPLYSAGGAVPTEQAGAKPLYASDPQAPNKTLNDALRALGVTFNLGIDTGNQYTQNPWAVDFKNGLEGGKNTSSGVGFSWEPHKLSKDSPWYAKVDVSAGSNGLGTRFDYASQWKIDENHTLAWANSGAFAFGHGAETVKPEDSVFGAGRRDSLAVLSSQLGYQLGNNIYGLGFTGLQAQGDFGRLYLSLPGIENSDSASIARALIMANRVPRSAMPQSSNAIGANVFTNLGGYLDVSAGGTYSSFKGAGSAFTPDISAKWDIGGTFGLQNPLLLSTNIVGLPTNPAYGDLKLEGNWGYVQAMTVRQNQVRVGDFTRTTSDGADGYSTDAGKRVNVDSKRLFIGKGEFPIGKEWSLGGYMINNGNVGLLGEYAPNEEILGGNFVARFVLGTKTQAGSFTWGQEGGANWYANVIRGNPSIASLLGGVNPNSLPLLAGGREPSSNGLSFTLGVRKTF